MWVSAHSLVLPFPCSVNLPEKLWGYMVREDGREGLSRNPSIISDRWAMFDYYCLIHKRKANYLLNHPIRRQPQKECLPVTHQQMFNNWLSWKKRKAPIYVPFVNFHGANTPPTASFKPTTWTWSGEMGIAALSSWSSVAPAHRRPLPCAKNTVKHFVLHFSCHRPACKTDLSDMSGISKLT